MPSGNGKRKRPIPSCEGGPIPSDHVVDVERLAKGSLGEVALRTVHHLDVTVETAIMVTTADRQIPLSMFTGARPRFHQSSDGSYLASSKLSRMVAATPQQKKKMALITLPPWIAPLDPVDTDASEPMPGLFLVARWEARRHPKVRFENA